MGFSARWPAVLWEAVYLFRRATTTTKLITRLPHVSVAVNTLRPPPHTDKLPRIATNPLYALADCSVIG